MEFGHGGVIMAETSAIVEAKFERLADRGLDKASVGGPEDGFFGVALLATPQDPGGTLTNLRERFASRGGAMDRIGAYIGPFLDTPCLNLFWIHSFPCAHTNFAQIGIFQHRQIMVPGNCPGCITGAL